MLQIIQFINSLWITQRLIYIRDKIAPGETKLKNGLIFEYNVMLKLTCAKWNSGTSLLGLIRDLEQFSGAGICVDVPFPNE